jgi:hypothetical protein
MGICLNEYTEEHLESIPPEYIVAAEKTVLMLQGKLDYIDDVDTCLAYIAGIDCRQSWSETRLCPKYIVYYVDKSPCACYAFGKEDCIKLLNNLIDQWKKWAGI